MEAPLADNARRQPVVLKGLPLLALTFQTLGLFSIVPSSCRHPVSLAAQGLSTPILPRLVLMPLIEASSLAHILF